MTASFDDVSVFEHHDRIGVTHRGQSMRDHKDGAPFHQRIHALLDQTFRTGIDAAGRFIQDEHRRIGDRCTGDGQQLSLALREIGSIPADHPPSADAV